jgi:predicted DNA-binding protein
MKKRIYTEGTSVFLSPEMYQAVRKESDDLGISLSELFREMVREYFERRQDNSKPVNNTDGGPK